MVLGAVIEQRVICQKQIAVKVLMLNPFHIPLLQDQEVGVATLVGTLHQPHLQDQALHPHQGFIPPLKNHP